MWHIFLLLARLRRICGVQTAPLFALTGWVVSSAVAAGIEPGWPHLARQYLASSVVPARQFANRPSVVLDTFG
jgi:hypothetical protein